MLLTPKKTVETIIDGGNHYVLAVKGNQQTLHEEAKRITETQNPMDYFSETEQNRGCVISWEISVFDAENSPKAKEWQNLQRIIYVKKHSFHIEKQEHIKNERYYITNLKNCNAEYYYKGVRGHWKIENNLHWVKDVIHGEDRNRVRDKNNAVNQSVISTIALNLHRMNNPTVSILDNQILFRANIKKAMSVIRT